MTDTLTYEDKLRIFAAEFDRRGDAERELRMEVDRLQAIVDRVQAIRLPVHVPTCDVPECAFCGGE